MNIKWIELKKLKMKIKEALDNVGGLSNPGKMPGFGWSISARRCDIGGKLVDVKGSVCEGCYALKNRYIWNPIQTALEKRYNAWQIIVNNGSSQ